MQLTDPRVVPHALVNVGWYVLRLAWFAAPWSVLAFAVVGMWLRAVAEGRGPERFELASSRGIQWVVLTTVMFIAVLSPALVRAERFIFPAYFMIAAVGVVAAIRGVRRYRPSGAAGRSICLAAGRDLDGDVSSQSGEQGRPALERGPHQCVRPYTM